MCSAATFGGHWLLDGLDGRSVWPTLLDRLVSSTFDGLVWWARLIDDFHVLITKLHGSEEYNSIGFEGMVRTYILQLCCHLLFDAGNPLHRAKSPRWEHEISGRGSPWQIWNLRGKEGVESELRPLHRSHEAARDAGEGERGCVRSDTVGAGTTLEQHEDARTVPRSSWEVDEAALSFRFLGRHMWVPS